MPKSSNGRLQTPTGYLRRAGVGPASQNPDFVEPGAGDGSLVTAGAAVVSASFTLARVWIEGGASVSMIITSTPPREIAAMMMKAIT